MNPQKEIIALRKSLIEKNAQLGIYRKMATDTALELRETLEKLDKIQNLVKEGLRLDLEYDVNNIINE